MLRVELRQVDARAGGDIVAASFRRPIEQARGRAAHVAGIGYRRNAEFAGNEIVRQRRNVVLGDFAGDLLAELWADEAPQVAPNIVPAFDPGPHFPVRLADRRLHPLDPLLDDLVDGLALFRLARLLLPQTICNVLPVADPSFEGIDLGAGLLDREGFGVIDAQPFGPLLTSGPVGELEEEGRDPGRDDADVEARTFSVVELHPLG